MAHFFGIRCLFTRKPKYLPVSPGNYTVHPLDVRWSRRNDGAHFMELTFEVLLAKPESKAGAL